MNEWMCRLEHAYVYIYKATILAGTIKVPTHYIFIFIFIYIGFECWKLPLMDACVIWLTWNPQSNTVNEEVN